MYPCSVCCCLFVSGRCLSGEVWVDFTDEGEDEADLCQGSPQGDHLPGFIFL